MTKQDKTTSQVIIYGAKGLQTTATYKWLVANSYEIIAFCDRNPDLRGKEIIDGIKCISPDELGAGDFVVNAVINASESVKQFLDDRQIKSACIGDMIRHIECDTIQQVSDYMEDAESKRTLAAIWEARSSGDFSLLNSIAKPHRDMYFDAVPYPQPCSFCDCGAFVGDTIEQLLFEHVGQVQNIYAFEPDERNFNSLRKRCLRLSDEWSMNTNQFILYNVGVSYGSANASIKRSLVGGAGSSIDFSGSEGVKVVSLDEILDKKIDVLKMDIEGFELLALQGAKKLISTQKPILAICIYHKVFDLYEIPMYIKTLVPEYKMKVRHYSKRMDETVLYCYI